MIGIKSYGAYLPLYKLDRSLIAKAWDFPFVPGSKAVANIDEDSLTMATEAGFDCLAKLDPGKVDGLFFATTTAPYLEKQSASLIAAVLDMRKNILTSDFTNSLKAGTTALRAAYDAIKSGSAKSILVIASDKREPEPETMFEYQFGDGAAALLIAEDDVAASIEGYYSISEEITGPWRRAGDPYVRQFQIKLETLHGYMRNIIAAMKGVMEKYGVDAKEVAKFAYYAPEPRAHARVAGQMGLPAEAIVDSLFFDIGNTGTPLSFMVLISALEEANAGDKIIMAGYGDGADAFYLRVTDKMEEARQRSNGIAGNLKTMKMLENYNKYLAFRKLLERERYTRKSSPVTYWRDKKFELSLRGMKCKNCGVIQYPIWRACMECGAKDNSEEVKLLRKGKMFTFSLDHLVGGDYYETPVPRCVIDLDGGGRILLEMTDCDPSKVTIDMPVELTFRKIHEGAHFHNYYWKCRPVREVKKEVS